MPQLEHQELPQAQRVVPPARQVFVDQAVHEAWLEIPALAGSRGGEDVGEDVGQAAAEPGPSGTPKPCFFRSSMPGGRSPSPLP